MDGIKESLGSKLASGSTGAAAIFPCESEMANAIF
ncbi:hypothetical protein bpr_I0754 [Butyrivibrio proteoclasticus B316]|jgi:hypothetical protein|uniref:Uncharacterized protein n=1 Tax=Butyrivibrio proteoclasticus (strain ATCC 51982 / DSM 14932 / B316) TaxID=515622 RepID=E0S122_BUTPB|nr:hypothetical protein bpr_I0754 [Butyrivibrio proteoclasticus B316]